MLLQVLHFSNKINFVGFFYLSLVVVLFSVFFLVGFFILKFHIFLERLLTTFFFFQNMIMMIIFKNLIKENQIKLN